MVYTPRKLASVFEILENVFACTDVRIISSARMQTSYFGPLNEKATSHAQEVVLGLIFKPSSVEPDVFLDLI